MAKSTTTKSADPLIETPAPAGIPEMDYPSHERTYNRFLSLARWFVLHMIFILAALYFFIIASNPVAGTVTILVGIVLLLAGILKNPSVQKDVVGVLGKH